MAKMWKLVLCLMVSGWGGAAAEIGHNMNNITRSMLREVADVMEMVEVNYSTPIINTTYIASVEFDMRAMGPLYNSTHIIIDAIVNKQAYPEGIVTVADGHVYIKPVREEWRKLLVHYAGPTAFVVVAVLVIAVLPLAGLFWCCCYWCRVGRRRRPFDRKYDACLKGLLAIVLIALLTLFLFGVVCAFATDSQVESGTAEAADSLRAGLRDAREFLNATQAHAHWLLVVNYKELETKLNAMLYSIGMTASVKLGEFSRAVSVTTLNKMVQQLDDVQADLRTVHTLTATLRHKAEQLNSGLRKVKNQLLQTLAKCDQPKCVALQNKYKIGQLDTEIQYSQMLDKYFPTMPDVSDLLNNVTVLLESDIKSEVAEGQKVFRDIQRGIQRSVDVHVPGVQAALAEAGARLARAAAQAGWLAGNASARLDAAGGAADALAAARARGAGLRRGAGLGAAAALLLLTALLAWGLLCGVCGKRPDPYGAADCCSKAHGSRTLLCGSGMMFLLGGGVTLVLLAYFLVGVLAQRFICDPLTEPRGNLLFADLEKLVDLEKTLFNEQTDPDFNMTSVLVQCHKNYTVYETLQLRRLLDVEAAARALPGALRERVAAVRPQLAPRPVAILRAPARHKLRQLAASGLSDFDFDRIRSALETNMTSLALDSLGRQLNSTARSLQQPLFAAEAASLLAAARALAALVADVLQPMLRDSAALNATAARLRDALRFNHSSLKDAIAYLMHETTEAEVFLNTQGPDRLQNMTQEFAEVIASKLEEYLERVVHAAHHEVGRCGPLSNAFNATRDAACNKILMPTNGYWMSLCWCVLLFVPLLLVSQRLARLYLHVDAYPGPLVEAEYLYDAYADRDNVPLANAYKAEKRAGRDGRDARETRGARGGRGEGEARAAPAGAPLAARADAALAPALDAYHARRYNDMAPKHWEEGPPRYHGPTEYERPPPYYYPGPNAAGPSSEDLARMSVSNSSHPPEPGTSWAQYLHDSEPGPSPLTITKNRAAEQQMSGARKTRRLEDSPSAPRPSLKRVSDARAAPVRPEPSAGGAPASWAEYLASSPSPPRFSPLTVSSKTPGTPEHAATQGTGWSWTRYLNTSDRQ